VDILPEIFLPFRAGKQRRAPGLGLGLFIVQQLAAAHGGEVTVQSEPETGTTFLVRLPREGSLAAE